MNICLGFRSPDFSPGDPLIVRSVLKLLAKQLNSHTSVWYGEASKRFNKGVDVQPSLDHIVQCKHFVKPGTPSWLMPFDTAVYKHFVEQGKSICMIGLGGSSGWMAQHVNNETIKLLAKYLNDGGINFLSVRSQTTYSNWINAGADPEKVHLLPCPGYFFLSPNKPTISKKVVALDLLDPHRNAVVKPTGNFPRDYCTTFYKYFERIKYLYDELVEHGAEVHLCCHEGTSAQSTIHLIQNKTITNSKQLLNSRTEEKASSLFNLVTGIKEHFDGLKVHFFNAEEEFADFYNSIDVYIGGRIHGALPCAGIGKPVLALGVDMRQYTLEQIPYIAKLDIRYGHWNPDTVLDWYATLNPRGVSLSLLEFRKRKEEQYKALLDKNVRF